jgi:hypothetical protein
MKREMQLPLDAWQLIYGAISLISKVAAFVIAEYATYHSTREGSAEYRDSQ